MRKLFSLLLTSRGLLFVGMLLSVALLLFWEGKRYPMGRSDGHVTIGGRCWTL